MILLLVSFGIAAILAASVFWLKWTKIILKTLPRDLCALKRFAKVNWYLKKFIDNNETVPKLFRKTVDRYPNKVAIYFEDEKWTFQELEDFSNRIAQHFRKFLQKNDCVSLMMGNCPEYIGIWMGLSKIGVITACINTNLTGDLLGHSIRISNCKAIIFSSNFAKVIKSVENEEIKSVKHYEYTPKEGDEDVSAGSIDLRRILKEESSLPVEEIKDGNIKDQLMYVYTSGTTGLPKAAKISQKKYILTANGLYHMTVMTPNDIYYIPLPLYHSAGGMAAMGQCLIYGVTVVIRPKFSASRFWTDCIKYKCTAAHYIGEICRYILTTHKAGDPVPQHCLKKILGNGLRPQIWKEFVNAFQIPEVYEFYGATEGNCNLVNIDSKIGAVGFVPRYAQFIYPVTLIKCQQETSDPIRNEKGFCTRCQPHEPGLLIGEINPKRPLSEFAAYVDDKATEKKILRNVFRNGDTYFNTGDILVQDEYGYLFFKDRTGDTYRWKGENVATTEVEAVVANVSNLNDCVVFGVEVPNTEGKAGMMAIVDTDRQLDTKKLAVGLKAKLPPYAVPLFMRVVESLPMTGTFKVKKGDFQKEGFDLDLIKDDLYFLDAKNTDYVKMSKEMYQGIMNGSVKL